MTSIDLSSPEVIPLGADEPARQRPYARDAAAGGTPITPERLAELFGPVPMSRLVLNGDFSVRDEQFVRQLAEGEPKRLCELIEGVVLEKAMGTRESWIAVQLITVLNLFVRQHNLGEVLGADGMLRLQQNIYIPDVSFLSRDRLPEGRLPWEPGIAQLVPDLAVEVLSPSNTARELEMKRTAYFAAGVRQVWTIDPQTETLTVWDTPTTSTTFSKGQAFEALPVLPGLTVNVADLFPKA
jgi:Uma2 family endonuclease